MSKVSKSIHYVILENGYTLVKFHHEDGGQVYLKSIVRERIEELANHFFIIKSPSVSRDEFYDYLDSFKDSCYIKEIKENRATLETHNPF